MPASSSESEWHVPVGKTGAGSAIPSELLSRSECRVRRARHNEADMPRPRTAKNIHKRAHTLVPASPSRRHVDARQATSLPDRRKREITKNN